MNEIIDFIQKYPKEFNYPEKPIDKDKLSKSFQGIYDSLLSYKIKDKRNLQIKFNNKIAPGQIWLCKQQYYDTLGNIIIGEIPYLAVIVNEMEEFGEEFFVRIQPITPFTQFFADDEIMINNDSITGFEFIIETWNEQPVFVNILDEYIGNLDLTALDKKEETIKLSKLQKEFRKAEIRNTAYLRQSVNSFIEFQEKHKDNMVFLNINNSLHFPESKNNETTTINLINEPAENYLQAAKRGSVFDRPTFTFKNIAENSDLNIIVIKDNDNFIVSIRNTFNVKVRDSEGNVLKQTGENIYDGLRRGLYFVKIKEVKKEIRIILK